MSDKSLLRTLCLAVAIFPAGYALAVWADPDWTPWPCVTRCRICRRRVFVWQSYERRPYAVRAANPDVLAVSVSASGMVHTRCDGNPAFEVSITRGATP